MRLAIVAVGKLKESFYRDAVDEYLTRLRRYAKVDEVEVRESSVAEVAQGIKKVLTSRTHVIALTIDGTPRSSESLAQRIEELSQRSPDVSFVIGGADGIPTAITEIAHETMSLSRMTLPHRLARLVLVEQLYRAMTIRKGEPYHH